MAALVVQIKYVVMHLKYLLTFHEFLVICKNYQIFEKVAELV